MAKLSEKHFCIPHSPLEVRLAIQRDWPPLLQVVVYGQKRNEHKDPSYVRAINHFIDELKTYITNSGCFPLQGRLMLDPYEVSDELPLYIRYPSDPPPSYPISLIDMLIRDPIGRARRGNKNKKDADKLFGILSDNMPVFFTDLIPILEQDRFSSNRKSRGPHSIDIAMDKERKEAYVLLGVAPGDPWETVKKTYHDKARKAHPDTNGGVDDGSFHKLQVAYDLLRKWHEKSGK